MRVYFREKAKTLYNESSNKTSRNSAKKGAKNGVHKRAGKRESLPLVDLFKQLIIVTLIPTD